jgi:hypothetical protein
MTVVNVNKQKWEKTTPYGDYTKTPDRINSRTNKVTHVLREARALSVAGRHVGSKPMGKLLQAIARAHKAMAPSKVMSPEEEIQIAEEMKEEA